MLSRAKLLLVWVYFLKYNPWFPLSLPGVYFPSMLELNCRGKWGLDVSIRLNACPLDSISWVSRLLSHSEFLFVFYLWVLSPSIDLFEWQWRVSLSHSHTLPENIFGSCGFTYSNICLDTNLFPYNFSTYYSFTLYHTILSSPLSGRPIKLCFKWRTIYFQK